MEWFRFYHDAVDDPKVQKLSPILFKHWINLMCLASRNNERGTLPCVADLAFGLRISEPKMRSILGDLVKAGLLDSGGDTLQIHGWANRQKRSDDVTARVNKYRSGNGSETLQETFQVTGSETLPHVRAIETETEQRQNRTEQIPPPLPPKGESQPWDLLASLCEEVGSDPSVLSKRDKDRQMGVAKRLIEGGCSSDDIRHITRWLSGQSWVNGVDMNLIEKQMPKWRMAGKPESPPGSIRNGVPYFPPGSGDAAVEAWKRSAGVN